MTSAKKISYKISFEVLIPHMITIFLFIGCASCSAAYPIQAVLFHVDIRIKSARNLGCPTGNLVDLSRTSVAISGSKRNV
jgi:hypothetical protein